jgi:iron(III) transport system permease protein
VVGGKGGMARPIDLGPWHWAVFGFALAIMTLTMLLTTANTKLVSILICDLNESGDFGLISVLGLTLLVVTFVVVACVNRVSGSRQGGVRPVRY